MLYYFLKKLNIFQAKPKPKRSRKRHNTIPKSIRQEVWKYHCGCVYSHKCLGWCDNMITVFNFEVGHNIPFSKGGSNRIENLYPICSNCNKSMSNVYTISQWKKLLIKK